MQLDELKVRALRCLSVFVFIILAADMAAAQKPLVLRDGAAKAPVPEIITNGGGQVMQTGRGPGGLTTFLVNKDGKPVVFYLTPDGTTAIVGVLFDARTGQNLSDAYVERAQALVAGRGGASATAPIESLGDALPVAKHLASVAVSGVTEGSAPSEKMVFVFFDPRCPHCHVLFNKTREVAKRGVAIKWIPVNTLGDTGVPSSAAVLRRGVPAMRELSAGTLRPEGTPSALEQSSISANTVLLRAVTQAAGKPPATPTILYQGLNGRMSVIQDDGSDEKAFAAAFGR